MQSFGQLFRVAIFGESHGECVGITIDGIPPGLPVSIADFNHDLSRRKAGAKGTTPRKEEDLPKLISGVFNGYATGAPLTILFENNNTRSSDYHDLKAFHRPGHADFVAEEKFNGFQDYRGGGHFSGRLTLPIVAAGVIAKKILTSKVSIEASLDEIGGEADLEKGLQKAIDAKDSIGGIVSCRVQGLPIGLGEPFFDAVESRIAHAIFSIPAVKGIEFGSGFASAKMFGSQHNDVFIDEKGTTATNNAGGITGGITNGNELIFRVAIKPTSSIGKAQTTWNRERNQVDELTIKGRHDLCIALRVPVVVEAMTAITLADFHLQYLAYSTK